MKRRTEKNRKRCILKSSREAEASIDRDPDVRTKSFGLNWLDKLLRLDVIFGLRICTGPVFLLCSKHMERYFTRLVDGVVRNDTQTGRRNEWMTTSGARKVLLEIHEFFWLLHDGAIAAWLDIVSAKRTLSVRSREICHVTMDRTTRIAKSARALVESLGQARMVAGDATPKSARWQGNVSIAGRR